MRVACGLCVLLVGCHSAGQYGFSRTYSPLEAEQAAEQNAAAYDPVMVQRAPEAWRGESVSVYGVVKSRSAGPTGTTELVLGVRTLAPRNLCEEADEQTCRVTVSEREHAVVHALVKLSSEDEIGQHSMAPGSLVRVIGAVADEVAETGSPVIRGRYYRHWPRDFYVTTAARSYMRR